MCAYFGCESAIASSSASPEWVNGKQLLGLKKVEKIEEHGEAEDCMTVSSLGGGLLLANGFDT